MASTSCTFSCGPGDLHCGSMIHARAAPGHEQHNMRQESAICHQRRPIAALTISNDSHVRIIAWPGPARAWAAKSIQDKGRNELHTDNELEQRHVGRVLNELDQLLDKATHAVLVRSLARRPYGATHECITSARGAWAGVSGMDTVTHLSWARGPRWCGPEAGQRACGAARPIASAA
jgi:hypothetical protein